MESPCCSISAYNSRWPPPPPPRALLQRGPQQATVGHQQWFYYGKSDPISNFYAC